MEGSKLDQTNRGVNSTSRRMRENDRDGKSACMRVCVCVRMCVCKHSVTNQFSGHRSLEVENADAASIYEWNKMKYKRKLYLSKTESEKERETGDDTRDENVLYVRYVFIVRFISNDL